MLEHLWAALDAFVRSYGDMKFGLEQRIPFDADWLHIVVGPVIMAAATVISRQPLSSWFPWFVVVSIAVLNEMVDLSVKEKSIPRTSYAESATDLMLTIAVPTLVMLYARCRRRAGALRKT